MTMTSTTTDYERALAMLNGRKRRKLANNTYASLWDDGTVGILYHETYVLLYRPNGDVEYQSGGWLTYTTKDRLNSFGAENVTISQTPKEKSAATITIWQSRKRR